MINIDKLTDVISAYKEYFQEHWKNEKYKWEAIKQFHMNWDVNALDFISMFEKATEKTDNLLSANRFFPKGMIIEFAKADVETVRAMFIELYDESIDLEKRVEDFKVSAENLLKKYDDGTWKNHFQNTNAISTYLWLRFPDKYYIYKYSECLSVAKELQSDFIPKQTGLASEMIGGFHLYNEICYQLQQDVEIKKMLKNVLKENCYPDEELRTTTIDVGYFVSRFYSQKEDKHEWFPKDYNSGLTVDDWVDLLNDKDIFKESSLEIMKRIKDYGGMATCSQLSTKYGENNNFYNSGSSSLARRIAKKTNCPVMKIDDEKSKWWPILYMGKYADKNEKGIYIWKLRDELSQALEQVDLENVNLYSQDKHKNSEHRYWWLNANPKIWSFSEINIGEEQSYTLYNDNGNKRRIFQNFLDAKPGDIIIGYESYPVKQVVAIGKITKEQDGDNLYFEKIEGLTNPIDYSRLKSCIELEKMEYFTNPQGSLFKLTKGEYEFIMDLIRESNPLSSSDNTNESYSKKDFLKEVYMNEESFYTLTGLLKNKKNLILQGAPGVGKTFTAKRLAYVMIGEKDDSRIEFIQFHQNYSYEDFIMGYKPDGEGFKLTNGIFYKFCINALNHPDRDYFFIIDEINRGNMSKVFGELLMLIEKDYRGTSITLAYNGSSFSIPQNLYIIGMMNTADRSLAMIDYALRRRFSFFEIEPGFNSSGFKVYQESLNNETFNKLIDEIKKLNDEIRNDDSLGLGFCIGHSYFCGQDNCKEEWMKEVVYYDIIPTLQEYWFDDKDKLEKWKKILRGVFND